MRQVVITGLGVVSAIGTGIGEFSRRMFAGDSGAVEIRGDRVPANFPVRAGAPICAAKLPQAAVFEDSPVSKIPRHLRMTALATEEALRNLPEGLPVDAIVYAGHGSSGFDATTGSLRSFDPEAFDWNSCLPESPLELIRQIAEKQRHGPIDERGLVNVSNVTVSSNQAIGMAFQRVRSARSDRVITGAVYARLSSAELMNFHLLNTLTTAEGPAREASQPFSRGRSGFVLGEGAATLVLESRELAEARGATILGTICGYASTSDAFRITDGRPDASAAAEAMRRAVANAKLSREQIGAISAHGTSTPMNDRVETTAIKRAFDETAHRTPVISLKSQIGHCIVAAGALEAAASVLMLSEQRLAPTINYKEHDSDCDLDYVPNVSRPATLEHVLSNNFGFGGQNSCLVFGRRPM